jgi:D-serine deaminase-like pyridoxal phosphate-dependent protein
MQRRHFVGTLCAAPAVLKGARRSFSYAEVERMLATGEVRGRLTKDEIASPALLLDMDAFEANVAKMAAHCKQHHRALRPHGKTHKCPDIAKAMMRAGAVGACAAKLGEAEVFAANGVTGLLVTTAVIGRHKIDRAIDLARKQPDTIFSVDHAQNVNDLDEAAGAARIKLNLAIDLFVSNRTGVIPGEPALALAQHIDRKKHVRLQGIQAYAGGASHVTGFEARQRRSLADMTPAVETRRLIEKNGISCPWLSGGSTGTYNIDSEIDGITELQPGSFVFMDIDYNRIGGKNGPVYRDFQNSLTVLTTVVSKPNDRQAVVDGGLKAFSTDKPFPPAAKDIEGIVYHWGGDEHGRLDVSNASREVKIGDRIEFIVPHCDPSVNLYDRIYRVRGDQVEGVWRIAARGVSQ